ncbi:thiol reductant ABC exporter subunit CydC, partial [Jatrophihabitans sp.]|uniref:thiol reductant ABC exporter subunit CydC n=1 Tax=Jatrophihabitans sp. TaxID=1932789 RepID=UPI0030C6D464|nr:transporter, CydDC cysteine exporter (CydDC-E) family, permease/ATP-binding protein CydC [Jatrophihabitans sp.]
PPAAASITPAPQLHRLRLRDLAHEQGAVGKLVRAAALSAAAGVAGLALTASSTWLISRAAQHPNVQALAIAVVGVRTFAIARALLRYGERLSSHDAALDLLTGLRVRVFAALRPLGPAALGGYRRGDLLRRFVGDVDGVQEGLVRTVIPVAGAAVTGLATIVLAGVLAPVAGIVLAAALAVAGVAVPWAALRLDTGQAAAAELIGERDARSAALTEALPELIAYGVTQAAIEEIAELDARILSACRRSSWISAAGTFATGVTAAAALPGVLLAGAAAVHSGRLAVADLAVLAVCVLVGFEAVTPLPAAFASWGRCRAGLSRVAAVLSSPPAVPDPVSPTAVPAGPLGLCAAGVALAPAASSALVLHDVDLQLHPGMRIAVTGPSGSGKSTLLAALLRQIPVAAGRLGLAGGGSAVALSAVAADALPPAVAGSLQGDHVFDATLRDNLRVVRPSATDADLDAVAARAGLTGFVAGLRDGWGTPVGPDGADLSGGQRQRLLLARALLAAPLVLVLDEPTAHLDDVTARAILDDLLDATAGRTVVLSTHRRIEAHDVDATATIRQGRLQAVEVARAG